MSKMEKNEHLMVDIETLSHHNDAVITEIAAVKFNIYNGEILARFHCKIIVKDAIEHGLGVSEQTMKWWLTQPIEVFINSISGDFCLQSALSDLSKFIEVNFANIDQTFIWGNSARFDLGILENAYKVVGLALPWNTWNERCLRTLSALLPDIKKNTVFEGTKHEPLADCLHQVKYLTETYTKLLFKRP